MAWQKGLSRQEQVGDMQVKAQAREALVKAALADGLTPRQARQAVRMRFGVSAMTAYRDVRVVLGGTRTEKRPSCIRRGWPPVPAQEAFSRGLDRRTVDAGLLAFEDPPSTMLATVQLLQGRGAAWRVLVEDNEGRLALSKYWTAKQRQKAVLTDAASFDTGGRAGKLKAIRRYRAAKARVDKRWR